MPFLESEKLGPEVAILMLHSVLWHRLELEDMIEMCDDVRVEEEKCLGVVMSSKKTVRNV